MHSDMDKCIQSFHEHLRKSVIPSRPKGKEMYTMVGVVVEKPGDWILREIDIAAEMGAESFIVDANWYGNGDFPGDDWGRYRGRLGRGQLASPEDWLHAEKELMIKVCSLDSGWSRKRLVLKVSYSLNTRIGCSEPMITG